MIGRVLMALMLWLTLGLHLHAAGPLTNGAPGWLHTDALGSVRAVSQASGIVETSLYKPYGEQLEWGNAAPQETKGWIGERFDADASLQYLNARYYDPKLGIFLQPDWYEVMDAGVGTNRFGYSFGDPVNKMDPGGNDWVAPDGNVVDTDDEDIPGFSEFDPTENLDTLVVMAGGLAALPVAAAGLEATMGYAMAQAPNVTIAAMEVATAEATGMTVTIGSGAAIASKVAKEATEAALGAGVKSPTGSAAAIVTRNGDVVTGLSVKAAKGAKSERVVDEVVEQIADEAASALGGFAKGCYGRNCAEVEAVSKAMAQGLDLAGARIYAAIVGTRGGTKEPGSAMPLCGSCASWIKSFGIEFGE